MYTDMNNMELINQINIETKTIESIARIIKVDCKENVLSDAIIQAVHRIEDVSDILQKRDEVKC